MKKEYLETLLEDVKEKFDLVLEGHQSIRHEIKDMREEMNEKFEVVDFKLGALNRKIDDVDARLSKKIDDVDARLSRKIDDVDAKLSRKIDNVDAKLSKKIDGVASDLAAHRADTESHPKGYRVSD